MKLTVPGTKAAHGVVEALVPWIEEQWSEHAARGDRSMLIDAWACDAAVPLIYRSSWTDYLSPSEWQITPEALLELLRAELPPWFMLSLVPYRDGRTVHQYRLTFYGSTP